MDEPKLKTQKEPAKMEQIYRPTQTKQLQNQRRRLEYATENHKVGEEKHDDLLRVKRSYVLVTLRQKYRMIPARTNKILWLILRIMTE